MIEITNEEYYAWVAPDGNIQFALMEETEAKCIAIAKLFHGCGLSKSPFQMKREGFKIHKVIISAKSNGQSTATKNIPTEFIN